MKIALFEYTAPSMSRLQVIRDDKWGQSDQMIRTSEFIEVDFPLRPVEQQAPEEIAIIDHQIAEVAAKFTKVMEELKTRRADLLALSDLRVVA